MQMTGAEVMVKCLAEQGVTTAFWLPRRGDPAFL